MYVLLVAAKKGEWFDLAQEEKKSSLGDSGGDRSSKEVICDSSLRGENGSIVLTSEAEENVVDQEGQ